MKTVVINGECVLRIRGVHYLLYVYCNILIPAFAFAALSVQRVTRQLNWSSPRKHYVYSCHFCPVLTDVIVGQNGTVIFLYISFNENPFAGTRFLL